MIEFIDETQYQKMYLGTCKKYLWTTVFCFHHKKEEAIIEGTIGQLSRPYYLKETVSRIL